jgi:signal transduction histidine kinase
MRQFTADASHELLTPLTAIRTEAEVALRSARSPEQYQRVLGSVIEEVERMTKLADNLLLLSREDARVTPIVRRSLPLDELVSEVAEHMTAVAGEAGVTLTIGERPAATIEADEDRLRQASSTGWTMPSNIPHLAASSRFAAVSAMGGSRLR